MANDSAEQRLALALDVLREVRRGALHESCKDTPEDDLDPCWHCCDWSQVVDRIDAVLGDDKCEVGYFDVLIGLQQLVERAYKEAAADRSHFVGVDERWKTSESFKRMNELKAYIPALR